MYILKITVKNFPQFRCTLGNSIVLSLKNSQNDNICQNVHQNVLLNSEFICVDFLYRRNNKLILEAKYHELGKLVVKKKENAAH